jgi:hypothetical protein
MKPWPLIGSTAGSSGVPGDTYLPTDGRRQEWARQHLATSGPTDASRRSYRAAQSGHLFSARTFRVLAGTLPPISIVVATPEHMHPHKCSDGGS